MIEFEGVTKVFPGGTVAVEDLSLLAPAGRTTVVIGPAGSGKTVLLRMVNRMVDPSAGRVLLEGSPNTVPRRSQLRRGIGYFVQGGLFPHRTVAHNVETVPLLVGADRSTSRQIALALLERVGLSSVFADKYPGQLSAGQQARVGLARALAADPPVLLMDNPFAGLDPAVRGDLQDDLLELQRIAPKTILFTTQDIDEAIKLGDQIAVLSEGRMVQLATPQTLLSHPGSDFVADLLGRDRGIRKLTFLPAGELPLSPAATVQAGTTGFRARAIADSHRERWLLVLDPERRPRGWVDSAVLGPDEIISGSVVHPLGGTFYADESVLAALDAAILSAAGLAVCLGDDGRILGVVSHTEIARYLTGQRPAVPVANPFPVAASPAAAPAPAAPDARPAEGGGRRVPLTGVRRTTAEALTRSRREIPEATVWVDVDATGFLAARRELGVSVVALLSRFVVLGVQRFPELNARVEPDAVVLHDAVHLGVAAQTPRGLMVPVVHDAQAMTTRELGDALRELTERAREGTLTTHDLTGGTVTVNNYGVYGVDGSAAIIHHPEVAIVGMGRIVERPWVVDGALAVRSVSQLTLAFDHRACDGGVAGGFLRYVADCVESPVRALADL